MKVILLSLMIVCFFGYHANACYCGGDTSACCYFKGLVCQGFAEIRSEFNGTETVHGKVTVNEDDALPKKASKLKYRMPGGRNAEVTIEVQGNCCWKFYSRYETFSVM